MSRGIVVELTDDKTAVVLTSDMAFVRIPRQTSMSVGSEVDLALGADFERRRSKRRSNALIAKPLWSLAGAAAVAVLAVGIYAAANPSPARAMPYAYVSVDINPSVQFTINQDKRLLAVAGLDADGTRTLTGLHLIGDNLGDALRLYMAALTRQGFVKQKVSVIVATAMVDKKAQTSAASLATSVTADVKDALKGHSVDVASLVVPKDIVTLAQKQGVSPGRLALVIEAYHAGKKPSWNDIVHGRLAAAVGGQAQLATLMQQMANDQNIAADLSKLASVVNAKPQQDISTVVSSTVASSGDDSQGGQSQDGSALGSGVGRNHDHGTFPGAPYAHDGKERHNHPKGNHGGSESGIGNPQGGSTGLGDNWGLGGGDGHERHHHHNGDAGDGMNQDGQGAQMSQDGQSASSDGQAGQGDQGDPGKHRGHGHDN